MYLSARTRTRALTWKARQAHVTTTAKVLASGFFLGVFVCVAQEKSRIRRFGASCSFRAGLYLQFCTFGTFRYLFALKHKGAESFQSGTPKATSSSNLASNPNADHSSYHYQPIHCIHFFTFFPQDIDSLLIASI